MPIPGRVACVARPCGRTCDAGRLKPGAVEWICEDCWRRVPAPTRKAYILARADGSWQLGGALWEWAAARQAAIDNFVL